MLVCVIAVTHLSLHPPQVERPLPWLPCTKLAAWEKVQDKFYNNVLFGAFLIYPLVSLSCLQAFNCHSTLELLGVITVDSRMS